jgi:hypothetical protein
MRAQCLRHVFGQHSEYNIGYIVAPHMKKSESTKLLGAFCRPDATINIIG